MASPEFNRAVTAEIERILKSPSEVARLGISGDIVRGWQGYFARYDAPQMAERVSKVCSDNKVPLDTYERGKRPGSAAEAMLAAVDAFYRLKINPRSVV